MERDSEREGMFDGGPAAELQGVPREAINISPLPPADDTSSGSVILKKHPVSNSPTNPLCSNESTPAMGVFDYARQSGAYEEQKPSKRDSGFGSQLGSTIYRVLTLMRREWVSSLCEFIIPILFVLGTVLAWSYFVTSMVMEEEYYHTFSLDGYDRMMTSIRDGACYDEARTTVPINGLPPCDFSAQFLYCPDGGGIPAGFCYPDSFKYSATSAGYYFARGAAAIPAFDDLVMLHWCNLDEFFKRRYDLSIQRGLKHGGKLYFAPDNAEVRNLVSHLTASTRFFGNVFGGIFSSPEEAQKHVQQLNDDKNPSWGIVVVNSLRKDKFDVSIRLNSTALPSTKTLLEPYYIGGYVESNELYFVSGFLTLQTTIYNYYMKEILGATEDVPQIIFAPMPSAAYTDVAFLTFGSQFVPLIIVLGFLYPVSQMTKRIVLEKELRIREAMLIMGLSEFTMYSAWFLVYMAQFTVTSLIIAIIMKTTYLSHASFGYPFFLMLFFCFSLITLSGLIASLFNKSRMAALLSPLIYFIMAIPLFATQNVGGGGKIGMSFLSPSALSIGIQLLLSYEGGEGLKSSNLASEADKPNMLVILIILCADVVIYLALMVYFDLVLPKDWGTRKNPLFCIIDPIKWCCCRNRSYEDVDSIEDGRAEDGVFEPIVNGDTAPVRILGLRKTFKRGGKSFVAVNNLCWSLKEGEISVLLGHNGAGKSTTMNLMTGMLQPDGGDCTIYGKSIRYDTQGARREIGLCPQHNILWPNLTVREHLEYFAAIKGLHGVERETSIQRLLAAVDLAEKENYMSAKLSGGQKRKLSVAIAFVGGSRLVFLDEPTAGMDVGARRHTWGLLKEMSKHHTILLSTHFMDEADLLGNQVGIMSHGRLQCSGSNMFLKSQLGVGFVLTMSVSPHADRNRLDKFIRLHIDNAVSLTAGAGEVSYRLPMNSKSKFPSLFTAIESDGESNGVTAYSVSATTLEEIFLKIANGEVSQPANADQLESHQQQQHEGGSGGGAGDVQVGAKQDATSGAPNAVWDAPITEGSMSRMWLQFRAMMIKRFWNSLRDRRTQFFQIICPVGCVLLAMLLTLIQFWNSPPLDLDSNAYKQKIEVSVARNCEGVLDVSAPFSSKAETVLVGSGPYTLEGFSNILLSSFFAHKKPRYGAFTCGAYSDEVDSSSDETATTYDAIFFNSSALHEVGISMVNYYNARVRQITGNPNINLNTINAPMPRTKYQDNVMDALHSFIIAIIIMVPFSFIPSTFVAWIVKERECKARHLQNVSGLNFYIYWLSNFLFDAACYIITMFLVIAIFAMFSRKEYIGSDTIGPTILSFFLYGLSGIAMAYAVNFLFSRHSTAQNVVMLVNFIIGFLLVLTFGILQQVGGDGTKRNIKILKWFIRIFPSYCVGESISVLGTTYAFNELIPDLAEEMGTPWSQVKWPCIYMAIEVPVFMMITLLVEHPGLRQRGKRLIQFGNANPDIDSDEDCDVTAEREAVLHDPSRENDLVRVQNLRKVYGNNKVAVRDLTFGVKAGEVFGFLGTNGAGKTTAISILCQEFLPTSGRGSICGNDIVDASQEALSCIGYCPQFDACLDLLTVEEHLYLYAGVRGIRADAAQRVVEGLMKLCELTPYSNTCSNALSGGNRRKLSVAIALTGGPRVVFLDEPSAGMDPVARRGLWNAIETVADNCSIVLTTHHLEEVEALAHRVAIMVDGALHCIGDKTHLKAKFGAGYEVSLRVSADSDPTAMDAVKEYVATTFPSSKLVEERIGRLTYEVPNTVKLSEVFMHLEDSHARLGVADYSVSQTSIEQVFMRISAEADIKREAEERAKEEERAARGSCGCCGCCCHCCLRCCCCC